MRCGQHTVRLCCSIWCPAGSLWRLQIRRSWPQGNIWNLRSSGAGTVLPQSLTWKKQTRKSKSRKNSHRLEGEGKDRSVSEFAKHCVQICVIATPLYKMSSDINTKNIRHEHKVKLRSLWTPIKDNLWKGVPTKTSNKKNCRRHS